MPKVLPIFPLYPSPSFLQYNVSLAIPGPKLWDLPKIGPFAKESNFPNTQAAILIPDIEYLKRFANYELGIADAMLKATQAQNIAKIKDPSLKAKFDELYGSSSKKTGQFRDGLGFAPLEKTILSSVFETQKPYFEIAQFAIKSLAKIEDIIARISPLLGAAINPPMALAMKSRKPKGNGPQQSGILGPYGTPPALGYKNGKEINTKLDKVKTLLQKGDGVEIDRSGKYTKKPKKPTGSGATSSSSTGENSDYNLGDSSGGNGLGNLQFSYITISTIYSTGAFIPEENYVYRYINLPADEELPEVVTPEEAPEKDIKPDRIIFGIYNKNGTAINPMSKIKYWGPNQLGTDLEIQDTIFEAAPWIINEKWIFGKSIDYKDSLSWQTLEIENYKWKKGSSIKTQKDSPGDDWQKLKYKDVINFNNEKYQYLKYKEDDYIVEFGTPTIGDYRRYYDYLVEKELVKRNVGPEDRADVLSQVEKLFSDEFKNDKIIEQLQNLIKYGDFKNSYVLGVDKIDWNKVVSNTQPPTDSIPDPVRKIFKPMRFTIDNETVWIDPELEYDLKVIRVDPVLKLDYTDSRALSREKRAGENKTGKKGLTKEDGPKTAKELINKNSNISTFIKNKINIFVTDKATGDRVKFSAKKYRADTEYYSDLAPQQETLKNIDSYNINNWNINFDPNNGNKQINNNPIALKLFFDLESGYPLILKRNFNREYLGGNVYNPNSSYVDGTNGLNAELSYSTLSFTENINAFLTLADSNSDTEFNELMKKWGLDWSKSKFQKFVDNSQWVIDKINEIGNVSVQAEKVDWIDTPTSLKHDGGEPKFQDLEYVYITREVLKPLEVADAILNTYQAVVNLLALNIAQAINDIRQAIDSFKDARTTFLYYKKSIKTSSKTTVPNSPEIWRGDGRGAWSLTLQNGVVKEFAFFRGVINQETVVSLGYFINPGSFDFPGSNQLGSVINTITDKALPLFGRENDLEFRVGEAGLVSYPAVEPLTQAQFNPLFNLKASIIITSKQLERFQISVFESGKYRSISSKNYGVKSVLNKKIQELGKQGKGYSKGRYGAGWKGGPAKNENGSPVLNEDGTQFIEPDNPQYVGYLRRSQLSELDLETYYIIEGYKKTKNELTSSGNDPGGFGGGGKGSGTSGNSGGAGGSGGGFYRLPDAIGIIKVMIELTVELAIKLFPAINKLIALIKNPASFVTEIIKAKLEEHFIIFSPKVTEVIQKVSEESPKIKSIKNKDLRDDKIEELRTYVKATEIGNYLYIDENADFRFVIDGPGLIGFFGILFGIELNFSKAFSGGIPIKPIFSAPNPGNFDGFIDKFGLKKPNPSKNNNSIYGNKDPNVTDDNKTDLEDKVIRNLDLTKPDEISKNKIVSSNGKTEYYEEVEITYSTGKFIKGVDYEYIYIDQQIESLIRDGDELVSDTAEIDFSGTASSPIDALQLATEKYQQAYDLIDKDDKSKESLKKLLIDKIKALKGKINIVSQPLMKLILGIVTLPLKIVFSIIKWLLDFFKKLVNPIKFPSLIAEFLSFKWIMQFFTPKGLLEIAGIKFKPEKVVEWCIAVNIPNPLFGKLPDMPQYLVPDDYIIADLNEFLSVGFEAKLPVFTAKQYRDLCLRPFRLFFVFLCFIERIINAFIMLIWSIMGITAVIPPPLIKLCKRIPENMNPKDLQDIVNGLFKDGDQSVVDPNLSVEELINKAAGGGDPSNGDSYDFIYEVKLPDGTVKKQLDAEEVKKVMEANKNLDFDFLNFETLE